MSMSELMRAVVIARYGGVLEVTRCPIPRPGSGEVLVHVRASGLCSTDLHLLSGRQPLGELPRIVGHELAGEVIALGDGVTHWRPGDRVTASIDVTCGHCRHCLTGETQRCLAMRVSASNGTAGTRITSRCRPRIWSRCRRRFPTRRRRSCRTPSPACTTA
jgi:D-arabinose 1-dehydrogenase-like Zn-dependent alcohol dehydrogenase